MRGWSEEMRSDYCGGKGNTAMTSDGCADDLQSVVRFYAAHAGKP